MIDDYSQLQVLPIEIKSGKDYKVHSALDKFLSNHDYHISRGIVLSNERRVFQEQGITYMPIYYVMFFNNSLQSSPDCIIPDVPNIF